MLEGFVLLDLGQQLEPVHIGHVDVADDKVEGAVAQLGEGNDAVFRFVGIGVTDFLEQVAHDAAHGGEVVNDQEFHRGGHACLRGRVGRWGGDGGCSAAAP
ncbi:hypothetical protein D9M68_870210 [compost metagenome]